MHCGIGMLVQKLLVRSHYQNCQVLSKSLQKFSLKYPLDKSFHQFARNFSKMPSESYKLTYFNVRARAEPIRFIFAAAEVPYEDVRIDRAEWPKMKPSFPWEKVPVLEVDGQVLAESSAICRFLGRKFNLIGKNEFEAGKCDEYVDAMMDLRAHWRAYFWESDENKKAELKKQFLETQVPNCLSKFEKILEKSDGAFLLGKDHTWADHHIAHTMAFYEETVDPEVLKGYPNILKFKDAVFNIPQIKKWVEERPKTNM